MSFAGSRWRAGCTLATTASDVDGVLGFSGSVEEMLCDGAFGLHIGDPRLGEAYEFSLGLV